MLLTTSPAYAWERNFNNSGNYNQNRNSAGIYQGDTNNIVIYPNPNFVGPNQAAGGQFYGRAHEFDNSNCWGSGC